MRLKIKTVAIRNESSDRINLICDFGWSFRKHAIF